MTLQPTPDGTATRTPSAELATLDAVQAIQDAWSLSNEFQKLCSEISSVEQSGMYGVEDCLNSRQTGVDTQAGLRCQEGPKRGSLRVFAQQVLEKVRLKGCTTYQIIADELIAELHETKRQARAAEAASQDAKRRRTGDHAAASKVPDADDGEKNIRRRVYDSLNVLKAVGAVIPLRGLTGTSGKEVVWAGLPSGMEEVRAAQEMQENLKNQVRLAQKQHDQLQALATQYELLSSLAQRNRLRSQEGPTQSPTAAVIPLPFVLLTADADATCHATISGDHRLATFNFHSSPFQVLEDYVVLEHMDMPSAHGLESGIAA